MHPDQAARLGVNLAHPPTAQYNCTNPWAALQANSGVGGVGAPIAVPPSIMTAFSQNPPEACITQVSTGGRRMRPKRPLLPFPPPLPHRRMLPDGRAFRQAATPRACRLTSPPTPLLMPLPAA